MSVLSNFESKVERAVDGAAAAVFSSPIEPAQIAKKAEKQMRREKLVGSGRQYAPTLYNVLVNERDDKRLFGFYPTMASEIENYLYAKGTDAGMEFDTRPLVRFITDPGLKKGRFDVIAEVVSAPIIDKLRIEEQEYYGLAPKSSAAARKQREVPAVAPAHNKESPRIQDKGDRAAADPNGKFVGLGVPADIDAPSSLSALPPLSLGKEALGKASDAGAQDAQQAAGSVQKRRAAAMLKPQTMTTPAAASLSEKREGALGSAVLYSVSEQKYYQLKQRIFTVGRGKDNKIKIADANASRVHAQFSQDATGRWKVSDLDSTNGTLVNGRQVGSALLKGGDEITIGTTVLRFTE